MGRALQVIANSLTYEGQALHIIINYALVALTVVPFLCPRCRGQRRSSYAWLGSLAAAAGVQVVVWFAAQAVGVSIIWCAMAGYLFIDYTRGNSGQAREKPQLAMVALVAAGLGIAYYAVTSPIETTVAHLVALVMGIGAFFFIQFLSSQR